MLEELRKLGDLPMDEHLQWLLAGLGICLLAAWWGYGALKRARGGRKSGAAPIDASAQAEAKRTAAHDIQLADAQRRTQDEQARAADARLATERATQATAARLAAQRADRAQAARLAAQATAREEALHRAQRDATRAEAERLAAVEAARGHAAREAAAQAARHHEARQAAEEEQRVQHARAAQEAQRAEAERRPAALALAKTPGQTLVMVADDSKVVRIKTGRLLAQHEYRVCYATDGLDAAQQLQTSMPDIVITDVEMPGMDGFELTRRVRQNPATAHIPIIMITAADERHRADANRAGVSVLLGKPYPDEALLAHIRQAMNHDDAPCGTRAEHSRKGQLSELDALA
jgi:CheY-like chemotaxis protein